MLEAPLFYISSQRITASLRELICQQHGNYKDQKLLFDDCALILNIRSSTNCTLLTDNNLLFFLQGSPLYERKTKDTESIAKLLINSFRHNGISCLNSLSNDYLIFIYDHSKNRGYLQIDKIGQMRVAYGKLPDGSLCFSSDARTVAKILNSSSKINNQSLYDYVFFHQIPSPQTIFDGVHKLPPAGLLEWSPNFLKQSVYWNPDFVHKRLLTKETLYEQFFNEITTSVKNTNPHERTATFLSGGIDSSTITGLVSKLQGPGKPAYTIGFKQDGYDETEYARKAAKYFGAEIRIKYIDPQDVQVCIPKLSAIYDEPFGNSSAVPTLMCALQASSDGITHLLAGDGGDELFAGNTRYAKQHVFERYFYLPASFRSLLESILTSNLQSGYFTPLSKLSSYINQAKVPLPDRLESYNFLVREHNKNIFENDFLKDIDINNPFILLRQRYNALRDTNKLNRMLYLDWKFTLADNDLRKVLTTCNHSGIKVSFPWLDDRLLFFSSKIPPDLKMHGTNLRYFVKKALADFLPSSTLKKSKHGFGLPFGEWLKTSPELKAQVYVLLTKLAKRGVFRKEFIDNLIHMHKTSHAAYFGTMVWVLAMLESWLEYNLDAQQKSS